MYYKLLEEKIRTLLLDSYYEGLEDGSALTSNPELFSRREYLATYKLKIEEKIKKLEHYYVDKNKKTE